MATPPSSAAPRGIAETLDIVAAARACLEGLVEILADGKIGLADLPRILKLIKPLNKAVKGAPAVPAEIRDLDDAEIQQLLDEALPLAQAIAALVSSLKK